MKFRDYLKEEEMNEADMATAIGALSMALVMGSLFASVTSKDSTLNPIKHIKNVYGDWKTNRQLKKLSSDEQKNLINDIRFALQKLDPITKADVLSASKAIERKMKGTEDKEGIAKELEVIKKNVDVEKLKDIK